MEEWLIILAKAFFTGCAAVGFGILFNTPKKNLFVIFGGGAIAGLMKYSILYFTPGMVISATFFATLAMGGYTMAIASKRHEPQLIFAIPCVIPLVPGAFAYRTMLGLIKLSGQMGPDYSTTISETVHNGAITLFTIMAFSVGVIITNWGEKTLKRK